MDKNIKKSKGILEGLNLGISEVKNKGTLEVKKESSKIKRSYCISEGTIKKLERMKLEDFKAGTSLESIVEKAIIYYYENNHK